jgi:hypothetical protein
MRRAAVAAAAILTLAACTPSTGVPSPTTARSAPCRDLEPTVAAHPDPASAARALSTLTTFAAVAWNPSAPSAKRSTLTGGLFINFRPTWDGTNDAATNTNIQTIGNSDAETGNAPRHDPLTDLVILRGIDALLSTGVHNPGLDQLRCQLQPVTEAEFATYGVGRGWIYHELVDLSLLDSNGPWSNHARTFADLLAKQFADGIDPNSNFRPDWIAQSAAALTDAGNRFNQPGWTSTGHRLALDLCRTTADPRTGFFPGQAHPSPTGPATVVDPMVKVGSQAQLVDALLTVYDDTHDQEILAAVKKNLTSLQSPHIGIADTENGGWFYAVNVDGTGVRDSYKETRQAWLVGLFRHAAGNGLIPAELGEKLASIVREQMYQPDSRGYVYRVQGDWAPYVTIQHGRRVTENWVSSEATGIAVHALLGPLT